ncbi:MAG: outer membrane beta-barrel protein [Chlamydiales bacterium]|nr:outer membrane beta-barrel protein [Chlamydiales bacterium]NCF70091.1 outer membrane beta-barrel protein [Chlamydiales bacterium]
MKSLKKLIVTLVMAALPMSLAANEGWYTSVGAGASFPASAKADLVESKTKYKLSGKNGFTGKIALGYHLDPSFRVEGEVAYLSNNLRDVKSNGQSVLTSTKFDGHLNTWAAMVNAYYDVEADWMLKPYFGLGLGMAHTDTKIDGTVSGNAFEIKKSRSSLAYQGIVGVKYSISEGVDLGLEYRYFNVNSMKVLEKNTKSQYKINHDKHLVMLGLSYSF